MILYTTPRSANGRKPLAVCHHLGVEPETVSVDVYRGEGQTQEYLAINPWGKIPTLVDGDLTLWESNAILIYLAEEHGGHRLWAERPRQRAEIARWLFWESSHWQPAFVPVLGETVAALLRPEDGLRPEAPDWSEPVLARQLRFLEDHLEGCDFLAHDRLTLADFSVAAMMMYARAAAFPFGDYPRIGAWLERIETLESWRASSARAWGLDFL